MPTYVYHCAACHKSQDVVKPLSLLDRKEQCDECLTEMVRQLAAPMVLGDYAGYSCPITGAWIEGRKAHQENLRKHGCRVYEPGETEAYKQRRAKEDADFDSRIESTVEEFVETLPTPKKEQLAIELANGASTQVVRSTPTL